MEARVCIIRFWRTARRNLGATSDHRLPEPLIIYYGPYISDSPTFNAEFVCKLMDAFKWFENLLALIEKAPEMHGR
jgi:hypothetical protein